MSVPARHPQAAPAAVILAAGKGTRMKGDLPKVVHEVGGRPMVCSVVDACVAVGCTPVVVVVGYKHQMVREALGGAGERGVAFAMQDQQLGTGHAVLCAEGLLGAATGDVVILAGDGPLIRAGTLRTLIERHRASGAAATLATSIVDDPAGYGRIVRDASGKFRGIVEHKNATAEERAIREINPSYYCFRIADLFPALRTVERNPASGEYYLTDVLALLQSQGKRVEVVAAVPPEDVLSINTPEELATVDRIYRQRAAGGHEPAVGGRR